MRRLSLDDNDAKAREWFVEETKKLGCTKHVIDEVCLEAFISIWYKLADFYNPSLATSSP